MYFKFFIVNSLKTKAETKLSLIYLCIPSVHDEAFVLYMLKSMCSITTFPISISFFTKWKKWYLPLRGIVRVKRQEMEEDFVNCEVPHKCGEPSSYRTRTRIQQPHDLHLHSDLDLFLTLSY